MSAEDRQAWVAVAKETLSGIPADLLKIGCAEARKRCKFASEIVPMIFEQIEGYWNDRKRAAAFERARSEPLALAAPEPEYVTAEQMKQIIAEVAAERTVK